MKIDYPDDSIQALTNTWWEETSKNDLRRGRLIRAFIPHVDQIPSTLVIEGRTESTDHSRANYRIEPLRIKSPPPAPQLPVAALPHIQGEVRVVSRAKKRPALVLSTGGSILPDALRGGSSANWMTAPTLIVAPYYGVEASQKRAGWKPQLVDRIRRCEYPQYLWDKLPIDGAEFSILRFDHLQPVGMHHTAYEATPYCLGNEALTLVDEWVNWLMTGRMSKESILLGIREEFLKMP